MRKIFLLFLFISAGAFAQDKVKFAAKIENRNSDTITIIGKNFKKAIASDAKGNFKDAFAVQPGLYELNDGAEVATIYLKNGYDLSMTINAKMFDETISFKGKGEKENNFLAKKFLVIEKVGGELAATTDDAALAKVGEEDMKQLALALGDKTLDENFRKLVAAQMAEEKAELKEYVDGVIQKKKLNGKPSPLFAYENFKGGTTKLEDFKGKYVYIDVWATWCGPCRREIPYLQKLEEAYHGKNIEFVSISVDVKKDYKEWRKMVADKSLGGVQLYADKDWNSDFIKAYVINSIPRFILIDPKGNIVNADAARPSDPELKEQLDKLLK